MSGEIKMSDAATQALSEVIRQDVGDYCSFRLLKLCASVPASGSTEHDGVITQALVDALASFSQVVQDDSSMVHAIGQSFAQADARVARGIAAR